ncbi:MAG: ABC transporter substrate-binding protein [Firmicutes bacterium]|nr:ABC transporter substrate-binding protein [Bacillota bacterium]
MRRSFSLLLMVLLLSSILAGCAAGQPANPTKPATPAKILVFGRGADSDRLDPARTMSAESTKIITNVFDTLVQFKQGTTEIEPGLAERYEPSPDGTEYIFYLRRGVKFHDGTPCNADAVLFSFKRQMDPKNEYHRDDMANAVMTLGAVKDVVRVDDYTVKFILKNPFAPFLRNIASFSNAIVSPTAVKKYGDDFFKNPVGTGPFKFVKWDRDSEIVLAANKEYWGGSPKVDQVVFRVIPENSVRLAELETGNIQMMDGLDPNDIERVKKNSELKLSSQPGLNINYMGFPLQVKLFSDIRVRQAISYAINKENLVKYLYKGAALVATGPVPKSILEYNVAGYPYDPDKAKTLLKEAGFENGLKINLWCYPNPRPYNTAGAKLAEAVAADLQKVGITATIQTMEWTAYAARSKQKDNFDGPFFLGWMGDNGDVDNFLYALFSTDNIPGANRAHYSNAKVDELLLKAQKTIDEKARTELYRQAVDLIVKDAPWVFLTHSQDMVVSRKTVTGFVQSPLGRIILREVVAGR